MSLSELTLWLSGLAFLLAVVGWYLPGLRILTAPPVYLQQEYPPVSVIVAARNEARHLMGLLQSLLTQQYPDFEVILALNGCQDESVALARRVADKDPRLRVLELSEAGKKKAIEQAITCARYDVLLFTDADCQPVSPYWIREMAAACVEPFAGVLGYSPVRPGKGFLNVLARFDHFLVALQYLGAAAWGRPFMGVGRNLAYRRSVWQAVGGFSAHSDLASGDDDLLVQAAARRFRFQVQWHPESFVFTETPSSLGQFVRRKARHFTTGWRYHWLPLFFLQAHFWGRLGVWLSPAALSLTGWPWYHAMFFLMFYLLMSLWLWKAISTKLCEKHLVRYGIGCDMLLTFVWLVAGVLSLFRNSTKWT
ncbi:MAG: glycosyltransferase [Flavobacteriales bacterium]|nr:glycosyltransferase [Flavobacteriales bacterium]